MTPPRSLIPKDWRVFMSQVNPEQSIERTWIQETTEAHDRMSVYRGKFRESKQIISRIG
jgi:hypothetical protein